MKRVLVVDDSTFMRKTIRAAIEKGGYQVVGECADGLDAVEKYRNLLPDLVLLDYNMPGINGAKTARKIIEYDSTATIVMIAAVGTVEQITEAAQNGVKNYITKPFTPDQLLEKITKVMC